MSYNTQSPYEVLENLNNFIKRVKLELYVCMLWLEHRGCTTFHI